MSENETALINLIRQHENPEEAFIIAFKIITNFLTQLESSEEPSSVFLQELA